MNQRVECEREIGLPHFGTSVRCAKPVGHADNCIGPLFMPNGEYIGELEDGCTQPPTGRIHLVYRGRVLTWGDWQSGTD